MTDDVFRIGVFSKAAFVQKIMARNFDGMRTLDGRPVLASEYSPNGRWDALLLDSRSPLPDPPPPLAPDFPAIVLLPPRPFSYQLRPEWERLPKYRLTSRAQNLLEHLPIARVTGSFPLSPQQLWFAAAVIVIALGTAFYLALR